MATVSAETPVPEVQPSGGAHEQAASMGAQQEDLPPDGLRMVAVTEPSGIAYHPTRGTLWVVSDQGTLVEMNRNGRVLSELSIRGDLEGVAVHPVTGNVWVASERANSLLEYDIEIARVIRKLRVDFSSHGDFAGAARGNKGLEGVTFAKESDGRFRAYCVVESGPARVIRLAADVSAEATQRARRAINPLSLADVEAEEVGIDRSYDVGLARLSDITYVADPPMLVVISSGKNVVSSLDLAGRRLRSVPIAAHRPEGICFLPSGQGIVSMDVDPGYFAFRRDLLPALRP